jgi:hypothetical protein
MATGIGKMITGVIVIVLTLAMSSTLLIQYGNPAVAKNLSDQSNQTQGAFNANTFNPINSSVNSTAGFRAPLLSAGFFGYAFVFPAIFSLLVAVMNIPILLAQYFYIVLNILPLQIPISTITLVGDIYALAVLYIIVQFASAWSKYNLWASL